MEGGLPLWIQKPSFKPSCGFVTVSYGSCQGKVSFKDNSSTAWAGVKVAKYSKIDLSLKHENINKLINKRC